MKWRGQVISILYILFQFSCIVDRIAVTIMAAAIPVVGKQDNIPSRVRYRALCGADAQCTGIKTQFHTLSMAVIFK